MVIFFGNPGNWEWFAPIALAREEPVAEFVLGAFFACAVGSEFGDYLALGFLPRESVKFAGINERTVAGIGKRLVAFAFDNLYDWQVELLCEFEVALVVSGNGHDGAGSVADEHVVGDPDWNAGRGDWVNRVGAREYAGFFFGEVGSFEVAFAGGGFDVFFDFRFLLLDG